MSRQKKPLVSVIIPYYKNLKFITQAIKSITNQKGVSQQNIEIIVSDGDKTAKQKKSILSLSSNIVYIVNTNQEGPGGNRQTGLSLARGKYIVFLDSDDQLEPQFVKHSLKKLKGVNTQATVCFSRSFFEFDFILADKIRLAPLIFIRDIGLLTGLFFNHGHVFPSAFYLCQLSHMMYKSSALKDFKFNYDYRRGGEDWDLVVSTLSQGKIKVIPKRLLKFRYSPKSSTSSKQNRWLKWKSYSLLASRLPSRNKQGIFYQLFLFYIKLFRNNN